MDPKRVERLISTALAVAAILMAVSVGYREVALARTPNITPRADLEPRYYAEWRELLKITRNLGDTTGSVRLIEFTDLECGACGFFHRQTIPALKEQFGHDLSVGVVHLPLGNHRFAKPAAIAAECAADWGRFGAFLETVFRKQDSLGLKSWASYGLESGLKDTVAFQQCLRLQQLPRLVDSGMSAAARLDFNSTPTVLVNGWRVPRPSPQELSRVISEVLAGRKPFPGVPDERRRGR